MSDAGGFSGRGLMSTVTSDGEVTLTVEPIEVGEPRSDEVVIRVEASPINPSDLGLLLAGADVATATEVDGGAKLSLSPGALAASVARVGKAMPVGNEGAGTVVAAGDSDLAQSLEGRTVAYLGGAMYATHRTAKADQCLVLPEGATATEGASCFVNPLTALGMTETMRRENHPALVHTAAGSNLGQMLNRICPADGIGLVNIVRRQEHVDLLRSQGATHVVDSSTSTFREDLIAALIDTGATIAFDAIGGGELASDILAAMEAAASAGDGEFNRYGSTTHKQVYIYGGLDRSPSLLRRTYGMAWSVGGWLLPPFLAEVGPERAAELRQRVADELTTTFASHYSTTISLDEILDLDQMRAYTAMATGEKALVMPQT
ncbi:MAG: NADH oxidase [Actinomycetia bacterium]|nr:NADH oxidase [Actinomycetes bacterium]